MDEYKPVPDTIRPGLKLLLVGINPGIYTAKTGHHFAHRSNRFWRALYESGLTKELLAPNEKEKLLRYQIGITNMVARPTLKASELTKEELIKGGEILRGKIGKYKPEWVAIVGISSYRIAFGKPKALIGRQKEELAGAKTWVLPNPSGLNAHYPPSKLKEIFGQLREDIWGKN